MVLRASLATNNIDLRERHRLRPKKVERFHGQHLRISDVFEGNSLMLLSYPPMLNSLKRSFPCFFVRKFAVQYEIF